MMLDGLALRLAFWVGVGMTAAFFAGVFITLLLWGLCGAAGKGDER